LFATFCVVSCAISHPRPSHGKLGQEIIGPIEYDCPNNGVFPDEESCVNYVECWEGEANLWRCTDNMLFDLVYNGCNYAQYVHCEDRPRPTNYPSTLPPTIPTTTSNVTTSTTPRPPIDFTCPSDGVFPHAERCEYYWLCWAGEPELVHCQLDYLFDLVYMGCNFPDQTNCGNRTRPEEGTNPTTRTSTTSTPIITTDPGVTTSTDRPTSPQPTTTTTHNPNATTTTTTTTSDPVTGETSSPCEFQCPLPSDNNRYPDPCSCFFYYQCSNGAPTHMECAPGLHYNPVLGVCDYPENAGCNARKVVAFV